MPKRTEGKYSVRMDFEGADLDMFKALQTHYGISTGTDLISMLLKREYDGLKGRPRFEHVNMYDDHVKILDRELEGRGRLVSVYFKRDKAPFCDYDLGSECVHVDYAWEIPAVAAILRKAGMRSPGEKRAAK